MAKKTNTVFMCGECGYESPKWIGQCICGAWNTMTEEAAIDLHVDDKRRRTATTLGKSKPQLLKEVRSGNFSRLDTGIGELNRVLGGGLVKGSLTLISGEPGIGKSTIILQAAARIAAQYGPVLYVTGEESEEQVRMRADRVCAHPAAADTIPDNLYILSETNIERITQITGEMKPIFLIVDSIQTMYSGDIESAPGTVSQVRLCANELMRIGKGKEIPVFIVAHVNKSGDLAGPKIIEHLVDCVLSFTGERSQGLRILRAVKNRFGTTNEIGAFEMREEGLMEIENLSKSFLEDMEGDSEGSVATAVYEGTRPLLLEVQALTAPANIGFARRTAIGVDNNRLNMIIAVLEKKTGLSLINYDVYVNVVGGIKPEGTSLDLAVALAIYSSFKGIKTDSKTIAIGEIGLTGDLRSIQNAEKIVGEAERMGFKYIIMPEKNAARIKHNGRLKFYGITNIREALELLNSLKDN